MFKKKLNRTQIAVAAARAAARSITALMLICGITAIAHAQSSTVANTDGAFGLMSFTGNLYWTSNSSISEFRFSAVFHHLARRKDQYARR